MPIRPSLLLPAVALMLAAVSAPVASADAAQPPSPSSGSFQRSPIHIEFEQDRALSPDEPMYFVVGREGDDVVARFQLSFRYRIFDPVSALSRRFSPARNLYFGYTQTSLWNWSADSAPFEDTIYRPSLFWQDEASGRGFMPDAWRAGFEHASNGQAGNSSRSINTLFLRVMWWTQLGERELVFAPKLIYYLEKADNPDIDAYRGHIEWLFRYGSERSWLTEAKLRGSSTSKGSIEVNLSYPVRTPFFYRAGGFVYAQYFQGYGESLLGYDVESGPTLRIGYAIVR